MIKLDEIVACIGNGVLVLRRPANLGHFLSPAAGRRFL